MRETEAVERARHEMEVCNACRYCEGFCAVFPAVELRREFSAGDLSYLANLCHNCRGCYYACQYAPPHEWGINVPRTLAEVRAQSYAEYAWPPALAQAFDRNGTLVVAADRAGPGAGADPDHDAEHPGNLFAARPVAPNTFYAVIPLWAMQAVGLVTFLFSLFALGMGARNFWRDAGPGRSIGIGGRRAGVWDILTLRNLGGGGHGCNDESERFSMTRRWLHHGMFYGFLLCFAATCVGFVYHTFLGRAAPYPFISAPVLLGTVGGVLLAIGSIGLFAMKLVDDPMPAARRHAGRRRRACWCCWPGRRCPGWRCWGCAPPARWASRWRCTWASFSRCSWRCRTARWCTACTAPPRCCAGAGSASRAIKAATGR